MYPQVEDWPRLSLGRPGLGPAWAWTHPGLYYITGLLKKSPVVSFVLLELKPKQQRCKYWLFFNQCSSGKFSKIFLAPDNKTANEINRAPVTLKAPGICCKFSRENGKKISIVWHTDYGHPVKAKSKKSENLDRCGRQNMLRPYLKIWDWDLIFGRAVKAISSPSVRSPWYRSLSK